MLDNRGGAGENNNMEGASTRSHTRHVYVNSNTWREMKMAPKAAATASYKSASKAWSSQPDRNLLVVAMGLSVLVLRRRESKNVECGSCWEQ